MSETSAPENVATPDAIVLCSKCKLRPRADSKGTNPWCNECRADYQRDYVNGKDAKARREGFAAGVTAMRELIGAKMRSFGFARLSGMEAAAVVRAADSPKPEN
jgi:hypothetical protein